MSVRQFDVTEVVKDWAMEQFERKANRKESKLLCQKAVNVKVDWRNVTVIHEPTEYIPQPPKPGQGIKNNTILFNTSFTNKTNSKQCYTFKVERKTTSSCEVEIENSFTTGNEMAVKLTTPGEIMEASAGFKKEMTLTKLEGQSIEEELSWGTDSAIEVDARSTAIAKLVVKEEEYEGNFQIRTKMGGRVRISYYNLRDNNSFIKGIEGDIHDIIKPIVAQKKLDPADLGLEFENRLVIITTKGKCRFKYGVEQMAEVDQISL